MKILQINSVCGVGSTGRIATDLYKILEEQGHECVIAYGRGTAPKGIKSIKIGSEVDKYIHVAKTRIFDKHGFGSIKSTKKLIGEIESYNPDIIHLHNIHGYYVNVEILFNYLKKTNKKVVWTLHDCWAFTGHCSHFDYIGCDKWKKGCEKCEQKNEYPKSVFLDNSELNYLKKKELFTSIKDMIIVTPSKWLAKLVNDSFLGKYKVQVINNGIDLIVFKPTKSNFKEIHAISDKKIILGVANVWSDRKGLEYFNVLSEKLSDKYKIVLVGIKKEQMKKINKNILKIDRTDSISQLAEIYSAAYVFVNLTLEDTFPTTNIEALTCGIPIITFNTGGSSEIVSKDTGVIIKRGDIDGVIDAIKSKSIENINSHICSERAELYYNKKLKYLEYINTYMQV